MKLPKEIVDKFMTASTNIPMDVLKLGNGTFTLDNESFYLLCIHPSMAEHVKNFERNRIPGLVIENMYSNKWIKFSSGITITNEDMR